MEKEERMERGMKDEKDGAGAARLPRVVFLTSPALLASSCRVFLFARLGRPRRGRRWDLGRSLRPGRAGFGCRSGRGGGRAAPGSLSGGGRSARGGRRALLLRYYSVETKHVLRPSSAALARKRIFQSGWSQAFI